MKRATRFCAALLLLGATAVSADFAAAFLENGIGVRGPGMGGAHIAAVDDATAAYWNPAGLVRTRGKQLATALVPLSLDRVQNSASAALNVRGELAIGFTWLHAGVDQIEGRIGSGQRFGRIEDAENAFLVGVGRALGERLAVGFTMKILNQRIDVPGWQKAEASGHGLDLGLQFRLSEQIWLGAAVRNLGASLSWKVQRTAQQASDTEDELPRVGAVGLAWRPLKSLLLAADVGRAEGGFTGLGGEWQVNPMLALRGGIRRQPGEDGAGSVTAGLSLRPMRNERLQFHYAYAADPIGAGDRTLLGLSLKF